MQEPVHEASAASGHLGGAARTHRSLSGVRARAGRRGRVRRFRVSELQGRGHRRRNLLLERFPNRMRFIFRHFPLEEAHPHALLAAEAAEAAGGAGQILADARSAVPQSGASEGRGSIPLCRANWAATWRATPRRWTITSTCRRSASTSQSGRRSHIRATPTFFLNGVVQDISFGMKALHDAVAAALSRHRITRAP